MKKETVKTEQPCTLHSVNDWHILTYSIDIPLNRRSRKNKLGMPLDVVSGNNGFKPECIYQNDKGAKIVYVFEECTAKLVNRYAIYACI
jgi:hypothetical protein